MCLYILVFTFLVCSPVYMQMCIYTTLYTRIHAAIHSSSDEGLVFNARGYLRAYVYF